MHAKTHKSGTSLPSRGAEEREADCSNRDHALLKKPSGTMDRHFRDGLLVQQANSGPPEGLNFKLSVVNGLAPREQVETLLVAQMAEVHAAMMRFARRLSQADSLPEQDLAERAFNRLARTFTGQIETLQRQRARWQSEGQGAASVGCDGGRAIVGNVTQARSNIALEKDADLLPALTDARQTPMTLIGEPERAPAPVRRSRKNNG